MTNDKTALEKLKSNAVPTGITGMLGAAVMFALNAYTDLQAAYINLNQTLNTNNSLLEQNRDILVRNQTYIERLVERAEITFRKEQQQ